MHFRDKRMEFVANYPDGMQEEILSVPDYQFNWQIRHHVESKLVPAGTKIVAIGAFENSSQNRSSVLVCIGGRWNHSDLSGCAPRVVLAGRALGERGHIELSKAELGAMEGPRTRGSKPTRIFMKGWRISAHYIYKVHMKNDLDSCNGCNSCQFGAHNRITSLSQLLKNLTQLFEKEMLGSFLTGRL